MIDVVTPELRPMYADQLDQMWRQRYDVFVEKIGWQLPLSDDAARVEKDEFDTPEAVYLVVSKDGVNVQGSVRLIPTTRPHLMSEIFPYLCPEGVPRGDRIWEISRLYMCTEDLAADEARRLAILQAVGLIEAALLYGIEQLVFVTTADLTYLIEHKGYDYSYFGDPPDTSDGSRLVAGTLWVTPASLQRMRELHGVASPVIHIQRLPRAA